jgi:hypothetical protein
MLPFKSAAYPFNVNLSVILINATKQELIYPEEIQVFFIELYLIPICR